MLALKRSQASLTKRVSQLTGMLSELQPLWLSAPGDVQEQVQLAINAQTPRLGVCASALGSTADCNPSKAEGGAPSVSAAGGSQGPRALEGECAPLSGSQGASPRSVPALEKLPNPEGSTACKAFGAGRHSLNPGPDSDDNEVIITPPSTARHRLDDDDSAGEGEPALGEVTASSEHYHAVLASLTAEIAARKNLEEEVTALRRGRDVELTTAHPQAGLVAALESALKNGDASRKNLRSLTDSLAAEWAWHKWPSHDGAEFGSVPRPRQLWPGLTL